MSEQNTPGVEQSTADGTARPRIVMRCEPNIDISVARELFSYLQKALAEESIVEVDASEVENVDTAIIQLFHAFSLTAEKRGFPMQWKAVSDPVRKAVAELGLESDMALPE